MVLESTMICLDNSEWMRNGDYSPTRLDAQQDAVNLLFTTRMDSHPENTVGLLSMAGKGVDMLVSPTEDSKKLLAAFSRVLINGRCEFSTSVQIAQLALKHRKNKNGGQRIVVFLGSPINESEEQLTKIGKQLKKNNIAVDVVIMGEIDEIQAKMLAFINATNSSDNSHLIAVPPGVSPANAIMSSPLMMSEFGGGMGMDIGGGDQGGAAGAGAGGGQFAEYGGVDPALDPELAMALRASAEEARAHEAALAAAALTASAGSAGVTNAETSGAPPAAAPISEGSIDFDDEEALLQAALAISMQQDSHPPAAAVSAPVAAPASTAQENSGEAMDVDEEEEAMRQAMLLSLGESAPAQAPPAASSSVPQPAVSAPAATSGLSFLDEAFANELLGSLEGVDPNDPSILAIKEQLDAAKKSGEKKDDGKK